MAKAPGERYPTARDFKKTLDGITFELSPGSEAAPARLRASPKAGSPPRSPVPGSLAETLPESPPRRLRSTLPRGRRGSALHETDPAPPPARPEQRRAAPLSPEPKPSGAPEAPPGYAEEFRAELREALKPIAPPLPPPTPAPGRAPAAITAVLPESGVYLQFLDGATLQLSGKAEYNVGRGNPASAWYPEVDLAPRGGEEKGVSRHHARLRWKKDRLFVEDLDTVNGTFVNQQRLKKHQPHPLKSGDTLSFGWLTVSVRIYNRGP